MVERAREEDLAVVFGSRFLDDRTDAGLLKKIVLNLIRADKTDTAKTSLRLKRKRAAWDDDIRMKMLGIQPL